MPSGATPSAIAPQISQGFLTPFGFLVSATRSNAPLNCFGSVDNELEPVFASEARPAFAARAARAPIKAPIDYE